MGVAQLAGASARQQAVGTHPEAALSSLGSV